MSPSKPQDVDAGDRYWEEGWDGHERLQMQRMARLSLSEKLDWLEEAHELACNLEASRRRALAKPDSDAR